MRWAISPHDARPHAFEAAQLDGKAERGYTDTVCGRTVIVGCPIEVDTPLGAVCAVCAILDGWDLEVLLEDLGGVWLEDLDDDTSRAGGGPP